MNNTIKLVENGGIVPSPYERIVLESLPLGTWDGGAAADDIDPYGRDTEYSPSKRSYKPWPEIKQRHSMDDISNMLYNMRAYRDLNDSLQDDVNKAIKIYDALRQPSRNNPCLLNHIGDYFKELLELVERNAGNP